MVTLVHSFGHHLTGVRACIGLSETEATDQLSCRKLRDQAILDGLVGVCVNWEHDEGGLDGEGRAIATINILNGSVDQTVSCGRDSWQVIVSDGATKETLLSHLFHDVQVEVLLVVGLLDAGHQTLLRELFGCLVDGKLIISQQLIKLEGILKVELIKGGT